MTKLDEVALAIGRIRLALTDAQHDLDRLERELERIRPVAETVYAVPLRHQPGAQPLCVVCRAPQPCGEEEARHA